MGSCHPARREVSSMGATTQPASRPASDAVARYSRVARWLHWLGLVLLFQLWLGWWMVDLPKSPPGLRAGWFNLHKSIGLVLLLLVVARLWWRSAHPPPPFPALPHWQQVLARVNHGLLYAWMLLMPVTGYLGSSFSGYPVRLFGWTLPGWGWKWPAAKELLSRVHEALAWLLITLIVLHVLAVIWHALRKDKILQRMLPRRGQG